MSELIVMAVDSPSTAFSLRKEIEALGKDFAVEPEDVSVITRAAEGAVKLHPQVNRVAANAIGGTIWGAVLGVVFLMPVIGAAVGAGVGAVSGKLSSAGIDDDFLRRLGTEIAPGTAAVGLLARHVDPDAFDKLVQDYDATVLRAAISDEARKNLEGISRDALRDPAHKPMADFTDQPTL